MCIKLRMRKTCSISLVFNAKACLLRPVQARLEVRSKARISARAPSKPPLTPSTDSYGVRTGRPSPRRTIQLGKLCKDDLKPLRGFRERRRRIPPDASRVHKGNTRPLASYRAGRAKGQAEKIVTAGECARLTGTPACESAALAWRRRVYSRPRL